MRMYAVFSRFVVFCPDWSCHYRRKILNYTTFAELIFRIRLISAVIVASNRESKNTPSETYNRRDIPCYVPSNWANNYSFMIMSFGFAKPFVRLSLYIIIWRTTSDQEHQEVLNNIRHWDAKIIYADILPVRKEKDQQMWKLKTKRN